MVVNEEDVVNIMGGMEHAGGIKLNDHKRKLKNRFEICRKLGQGTYGKVQLGVNKETGQQVAIKTIKKSKIETEADLVRIRREIQIMSSVQHPNIIHIYEVFENKEKMVLVMEIAAGGELYDYLSDRKSLEEKEARRIFRQIATAVYYCHKHNICHRDLKLENILLDQDGAAKIADFGLSNVFDRKNLLSTFCGSPLYASPEIVRGSPYQGPEVDCWSLGVLLYTLVYGAMPFDGSNFKRLVKQITTGDYYEPKHPSTASSLIRGMLTVKAEERANIVDICSHWWVNDGYGQSCLDEAEYLASLTPVRLDLLLSLTRQENRQPPDEVKSEVATPTNKHTPSIDIEEIPAGVDIPEGVEECDVSLSEEPNDDKSPAPRRRPDQKRKLDERASLVEPEVVVKKQDNRASEESLLPPPPPPRIIPEPMECLPDQVYERPKERKAEGNESVDVEKTPKVRRKIKSSGDVIVYSDSSAANNDKENKQVTATPQMKRRQEDGRKTPKDGRKSRQSKSKTPDKATKEQKLRFERPEPLASPRPPRQMFSPELSPEKVSSKSVESAISNMQQPAQPPVLQEIKAPALPEAQPAQKSETAEDLPPVRPPEPVSDSVPPPLPEKKRKSNIIVRESRAPEPDQLIKQDVQPTLSSNLEPANLQSVKVREEPLKESNQNATTLNCDVNFDKANLNTLQLPSNSDRIDDKSEVVIENKMCDTQLSVPLESENMKIKSEADSKEQHCTMSEHVETGKLPNPTNSFKSQDDRLMTNNRENNNDVMLSSEVKDKSKEITNQLKQTSPIDKAEHLSLKVAPKDLEQKENSSITVQPIKPKEIKPSSQLENMTSLIEDQSKRQNKLIENQDMANNSQLTLDASKEIPKPIAVVSETMASPSSQAKKPVLESLEAAKTNSSESIKSPTRLVQAQNFSPPSKIKSSDTVNSPCSSPSLQRHEKSGVPVSINNLPKLVIRQNSKPETYSRSKDKISPLSEGVSSPVTKVSPSKEKEDPLLGTPPLHARSNDSVHPMKLVKQDSPKSLINNIPKPFKPESPKQKEVTPVFEKVLEDTKPVMETIDPVVKQPKDIQPQSAPTDSPTTSQEKPKSPLSPKPIINGPIICPTSPKEIQLPVNDFKSVRTSKSTDSVGSAISLSDDEKETSPKDKTPLILPKQNGPNINLSSLSPNNSSNSLGQKKGQEKRDSKVIKAAAYWNNYIGEVTSKSRPPSNVKQLDKPKKIVSAGIGERGLKELTNAFEQGKPIVQDEKFTLTRRNSKKMTVEPCNPGLRVNDAKSVFEKKFQQPIETPRLTRRGSSTLDKPKFSSPKKDFDSDDQSKQDSPPLYSPKLSHEMQNTKDSNHTLSINKPNDSQKPDIGVLDSRPKTPKESKKKTIPQIPQEKSQIPKPKQLSPELKAKSPEKVPTVPSKTVPAIVEHKVEDKGLKDQTTNQPSKIETPAVIDKEQQLAAPVKPPTSPKPSLKRDDLGRTVPSAQNDEKIKNDGGHLSTPNQLKVDNVTSTSVIEKKPKEVLAAEIKQVEPKIEPVVRPVRKEVTKIIFKNKPKAEEKRFNGFDANANNTATMAKEPETPKLFIKTVKIKSPEPDKKEAVTSPEPNLSEIRSSLKKVPHAASNLSKSSDLCQDDNGLQNGEPVNEIQPASPQGSQPIQETKPIAVIDDSLQKIEPKLPKETDQPAASPKKERIIPITFVNENLIPKPFKPEDDKSEMINTNSLETSGKAEHHIPIFVEGNTRPSVRNEEEMERLDNFNTNTISRRRWGSRKKRMSSAFSDSSMSDDDALGTPLSGLQKYSSYGKHGMSEQPLFRLKKTRPPFSVEKTDSFSSGEDDFDDDGFQEMTAENLFSTLLSRVKSLTRRIHDEHDDQISWQLTRHGPPKLNPGGTHARLERTAQRNSIKRSGDSASRQYSSYDDSGSQRPYDTSSSRYSSSYTPTKVYNRSNSLHDTESRYTSSGSKRYDENDATSDYSGGISVTSSQRLRPGYLPPPANHNPVASSKINNTTSLDISDLHSQNLTPRLESNLERNIPINVQKSNLIDSPVQSKPGTPVPTPGVYMKHMKPFNLNSYENNDRLDGAGYSTTPDVSSDSQRRVSRFLRPDFYDIPKEDSIYAKMREIEDEDKRKPRFLRSVQSRGRETLSGRSTPLDASSYSEDVPRSETRTPFGDSTAPNEGLKYHQQHQRPHINTLHNQYKKMEDSGIEQDVLLAGVNKLRRQGLEHSTEVSEISDGYRTPDSESITSDVFGAPDLLSEGDDSFQERLAQSGLLGKNSIERKISRGSISHDGGEDPVSSRYTSSRPVSRRSISRELFDLKYNNGRDLSKAVADYKRELTSPTTRRYSRHNSNTDYTSSSTDRHSLASDYRSGATSNLADRTRSISQSRAFGAVSPTSLSVGGVQNDILRRSPLTAGRISEDGLGYSTGGSLKDRNRQSWRRISVPERGKDFNTLPRKYNRLSSMHDVETGGGSSTIPVGFGTITRSGTRNLPPPSPVVVRRSSTQESFRRPSAIRKSATLDYPDFVGYDGGGGGGSPSLSAREVTPSRMMGMMGDVFTLPRDYSRGSIVGGGSSRDITPTQAREAAYSGWGGDMTPGARDVHAYGRRTPTYPLMNRNSVAGFSSSREGGGSVDAAPNFSRYSSILDDKHDWGFSTLSRRNSRSYNGYQ